MKNNIKTERKEAIALGYDPEGSDSPHVLAKGKGIIADNIITKAEENNIPIQEDPSLVSLLSKLNINENIPDELYQVVAELFAFVYRIDQKIDEK
ncbi:EscU/YscU/HrcU family type III secretion system export apparatus switch protein [Bacillus massilinigeriensis]|uniref:EscU/YscU/HrcU family type III secretion system export apparatus switch protein n=1 Tax=Bacillus massilionigeriensis TaxID=1805475 RepID=UPI00096ADC74|nr:EscU/YscU/HrcU family type III secretion system export apparatus switch protein [Bacillus massilionigeriensis]